MKDCPVFKTLLKNTDLVLAGIGLVILSTMTFLSIFARYLLHTPFMFLEELQTALLLWITMLSGIACFRYKQHVMVDVIVDMFPESVRRKLQILIPLAVVFVLGFITFFGTKFVIIQFNSNRYTDVLHIKFWLIYIIVPISSLFMMIQALKTDFFDFYFSKDKKEGNDNV